MTGLAADADPSQRQVVELTRWTRPRPTPLLGDAGRRRAAAARRRDGPAAPARALAARRRFALLPLPLAPGRRHARARRLPRARQHRPGRPRPDDCGAASAPRACRRAFCVSASTAARSRSWAASGRALELDVVFAGGDTERWGPVPDLLDSPPFAQQFVAEPTTTAGRCCASATASTGARSPARRR